MWRQLAAILMHKIKLIAINDLSDTRNKPALPSWEVMRLRTTRHSRSLANLLPPGLSGHTVSLDALHDGMKNELLWVAVESNDSPVGFILLSVLDAIIFIKEMDVHRHHQQQGLGRALISTALVAARQRGFSVAALTTFSSVPWNTPFYRKLEFTTLDYGNTPGVIRTILDNERDAGLKDRVAMVKDLQ